MIDNAADDWRIAMTWQRMMQVCKYLPILPPKNNFGKKKIFKIKKCKICHRPPNGQNFWSPENKCIFKFLLIFSVIINQRRLPPSAGSKNVLKNLLRPCTRVDWFFGHMSCCTKLLWDPKSKVSIWNVAFSLGAVPQSNPKDSAHKNVIWNF